VNDREGEREGGKWKWRYVYIWPKKWVRRERKKYYIKAKSVLKTFENIRIFSNN